MGDSLFQALAEAGADVNATMDRFLNNENLYKKFLFKFIDDPNFNLLKENLETGQFEDAFKAAHTLKGVSANLGLTPVYTPLSQLTEQLRSQEYDGWNTLFREVEENYNSICKIIEQHK